MAGTLTISTLSDGTNSTSSTNCIQGSAKAWVNFNAVAATVAASYNVGSITKNATGNWTVNMTNALSDVNYSVVASGTYSSETYSNFTVRPSLNYGYTTTTFRIFGSSYGSASTGMDGTNVYVAVFR